MTVLAGERSGSATAPEGTRQRLIEIVRARSLLRGTRIKLVSGAEIELLLQHEADPVRPRRGEPGRRLDARAGAA